MNEALRQRILAEEQRGLALRAIAELVGVSPTSVSRVLRDAGKTRARSVTAKAAWVMRSQKDSEHQLERKREREAEESRRREALHGAEVRVHTVDVQGERRVVLRLFHGVELVQQMSGSDGDMLGLGRAVHALLLRPANSARAAKVAAKNNGARGMDPRATSDRDASTLQGGERHGLERE